MNCHAQLFFQSSHGAFSSVLPSFFLSLSCGCVCCCTFLHLDCSLLMLVCLLVALLFLPLHLFRCSKRTNEEGGNLFFLVLWYASLFSSSFFAVACLCDLPMSCPHAIHPRQHPIDHCHCLLRRPLSHRAEPRSAVRPAAARPSPRTRPSPVAPRRARRRAARLLSAPLPRPTACGASTRRTRPALRCTSHNELYC